MTSAAHLRKGWCPGALRPMRSGDGLLVRVRPHAGAFSLSSLRAISAIAARFGSGDIDLTNRGNLQIRGVSDVAFESALAELDEAGLLDTSPDAEAVRNIVVDPLSGLDPERQDVRDLAAAFEGRIVRDARLWALPTKFGFSFSGSAEPRIGGRSTDIMIFAGDADTLIALDGAQGLACEVARGDAVDAAHHLALAFLEISGSDASFRRMRYAVSRLGAATLFAMAGLGPPRRTPASSERTSPIGLLARNDRVFGVGIGFPFGRATPVELDALCEAAAKANCENVHMSTERALVFSVCDVASGDFMRRSADAVGLITHADDVRLAIDVCPGSPACKNASTDTRQDALRFADTFCGSLGACTVHVSGCEKGCARRAEASFTFVGRGGRYDVVRNGSADSSDVHETIDPECMSAAVSRFLTEPAI